MVSTLLGYIREAIAPKWWSSFVVLTIALFIVVFLHARALAEINENKVDHETQMSRLEEKLDVLSEKISQQSSDIQYIKGYLTPRE